MQLAQPGWPLFHQRDKPLEPTEQVHQHRPPLRHRTEQSGERGAANLRGQRIEPAIPIGHAGPADVEPDAGHDGQPGRGRRAGHQLSQHAGEFGLASGGRRAADHHVVGPAQPYRLHAEVRRCLHGGQTERRGYERPPLDRRRRHQQHRHEQIRAGWREPAPVEPPPAGALVVSYPHEWPDLTGHGPRRQVGVGGAGFGDPFDTVETARFASTGGDAYRTDPRWFAYRSGFGHGPDNTGRWRAGGYCRRPYVARTRTERTGEPAGRNGQRVFAKVLIANRGEIAVRVIRACQELGIKTVAVYSELDRNALHVRLADEAYALGGQTAAESYLNTAAILDAIERSGAEAVHPGYGFFSENADFCRAITEKGVAFIGPPPPAIETMGDKISARKAAEAVGVMGVPGTTEFITSPDQVLAFGKEHGYPIAIKAAYGGGGRGMKVVPDQASIDEAIESAQRESKAYFGRDEIYMERYLTKPRHVEVQVLADSHGNCVYLGTRDCSAQRRHQKLVEEAPAAGIDPAILKAMGEAAVKVALGCGYVNAGTAEFLYEDGGFHFLEMNTRLQVEHPATEVVTRLDLVELQLRVAAGEKLPFKQKDVNILGHGIEIRINAEDPTAGKFLPSPGKITKLRVATGFGVRWDGGYEAGDEISQYYDNLVGKLIVWGKDRPTAIARAIRALRETEVEGVATTIPADLAILEHPDFAALEHSTKWVENALDLSGIGAPGAPAAETEPDAAPKVKRETTVEVNGKRFSVTMWVPESAGVAAAPAAAGGGGRSRRTGGGGGAGPASGDVTVPMQGTIIKVLVAVGDEVEAGQAVCVLEAMKMENNIAAGKAGRVKEVRVKPGDTVGSGDIVVVIE